MNFKNFVLVIASVSLTSVCFAADTGINPSKVEAKIYSVSLFKSALCTGEKVSTTEVASPSYSDFLGGPTLADEDNADGHLDGDYNCIVIKMSDQIRVTPETSSDSAHCVAGTPFVTDVCSVHGSPQQTQDLAGTVTDCTSGEDVAYLYISTGTSASSDGHNTWLPPTASDTNSGVNLGAKLTIAGAQSSVFVINAQGQVQDGGGECGMERPTFSFRDATSAVMKAKH